MPVSTRDANPWNDDLPSRPLLHWQRELLQSTQARPTHRVSQHLAALPAVRRG
jgi:hypothetical protein